MKMDFILITSTAFISIAKFGVKHIASIFQRLPVCNPSYVAAKKRRLQSEVATLTIANSCQSRR